MPYPTQRQQVPVARRSGSCLALVLAAVAATNVAAQPAAFRVIEAPPGDGTASGIGISADGAVVLADWSPLTGAHRSYLWSAGTGIELIVPPGANPSTYANALSGDGQFALVTIATGPAVYHAGNTVSIGRIAGIQGTYYGRGISFHGEAVAGNTDNAGPPKTPWLWTPSGGILPLPDFPGPTLGAEIAGVSADGRVVIGKGHLNGFHAVKWVDRAGPAMLQPDEYPIWSDAKAVSADGSAVVGQFLVNASGPYRFRSAGREHLDAGTATSVSGDGRIVILQGYPQLGVGVWDSAHGARSLGQALTDHGADLGGWSIQTAVVTLDGTAFTGSATDNAGVQRAYIARLPRQECYANCDESDTYPALNVADFLCFLNKYSAGDPAANCDGSTTPPVLSIADFVCFQMKFAAGCP